MTIAAIFVASGKGAGWKDAAHAIELGILFFSLIFIGPGKYSVDKD
jgi:putative oxidoreductase